MNKGPRDRGRSAPPASAPTARSKVFATSDDASAEHRRKLEALFSGKPGAETPRPRQSEPQVFASPRRSVGRAPSEYRMRLERLRIAREVEEIREATDGFLQHHQLPDDVDVLYKVLQHPSEKVVREALGQISSLLTQGRINSYMLLQDRLNTLSDRATEDATRAYIDGVRTQIAKLKG